MLINPHSEPSILTHLLLCIVLFRGERLLEVTRLSQIQIGLTAGRALALIDEEGVFFPGKRGEVLGQQREEPELDEGHRHVGIWWSHELNQDRLDV